MVGFKQLSAFLFDRSPVNTWSNLGFSCVRVDLKSFQGELEQAFKVFPVSSLLGQYCIRHRNNVADSVCHHHPFFITFIDDIARKRRNNVSEISFQRVSLCNLFSGPAPTAYCMFSACRYFVPVNSAHMESFKRQVNNCPSLDVDKCHQCRSSGSDTVSMS